MKVNRASRPTRRNCQNCQTKHTWLWFRTKSLLIKAPSLRIYQIKVPKLAVAVSGRVWRTGSPKILSKRDVTQPGNTALLRAEPRLSLLKPVRKRHHCRKEQTADSRPMCVFFKYLEKSKQACCIDSVSFSFQKGIYSFGNPQNFPVGLSREQFRTTMAFKLS